jgi:hypothetical protein
MESTEAVQRKVSAGEDAFEIFERCPDFPRLHGRTRERLAEAEREMSADARVYGSRARLEHVLHLFDIRAEGLLELVTDIETQRAFRFVQESLGCLAWREHTGAPIEVMHPASAQSDEYLATIETKGLWWIGEGYGRLESLRRAPVASEESSGTQTGKRITRTDIWKSARYKNRTEFERWERQDARRPNRAAHERFTQILNEKPDLK